MVKVVKKVVKNVKNVKKMKPFKSLCVKLIVPKECCYLFFGEGRHKYDSSSEEIIETCRGEELIIDYGADGRVIGIELLGKGKRCQ